MIEIAPRLFDLSSVRRKTLTVIFDGGNQSSDAGLPLLKGERSPSMTSTLTVFEGMAVALFRPKHASPDNDLLRDINDLHHDHYRSSYA